MFIMAQGILTPCLAISRPISGGCYLIRSSFWLLAVFSGIDFTGARFQKKPLNRQRPILPKRWERFTLSSGERAGVRASVKPFNSNVFCNPEAPLPISFGWDALRGIPFAENQSVVRPIPLKTAKKSRRDFGAALGDIHFCGFYRRNKGNQEDEESPLSL
jgi:hypothetical protein